MAEAEELRGMGCFSLARDPLNLCVNGGSFPANFDRRIQTKERNGGGAVAGGEEGEIELSLGLSLNGKFGVDPNRAQKLKRCSSISSFALNGEGTGARAFSPYAPPLSRTCSLPAEAETEEEWRRRKEAQSQKRLEAKRKRMEKMKNVRVVREKLDKEDPHFEENGSSNGNGLIPVLSNGNALPSSQGSSVSQGSGSSGVSDFDSQPLQVCGKNVEAPSPSSVHSRELEQRPATLPSSLHSREFEQRPATVLEPAVNNSGNSGKDCKEVVRNAMFNMPCVTTRGDGPNGKKIEGFLYRYRKGEEVRIVCVCHGSFLSPAEFVKHAGGGDVAHPLKHIIVTPSCLF
ncbi:ninja-family protein AFP3-like isoform X4 [Ipomoea triloba]|uniref:ninja-family protein AFP3-like isoform X3 n=1 Tax=Ipomoea triloba TaxID=35885 RepID=UPI00125D66A3|nr:ninja-family protein AFP3-like isoform X3 [Ipomoea triloba]XP_031106977.1 ninja-family protein AFP3-like isoform X4 [Ipomoea triloba]